MLRAYGERTVHTSNRYNILRIRTLDLAYNVERRKEILVEVSQDHFQIFETTSSWMNFHCLRCYQVRLLRLLSREYLIISGFCRWH